MSDPIDINITDEEYDAIVEEVEDSWTEFSNTPVGNWLMNNLQQMEPRNE